jgi:hypothetical protein
MFLAVLRVPDVPDAHDRAATAVGMARADARQRLAGVGPRVLAVSTDAAALEEAARRLEAAGFRAIVFDPLTAPGDDDRIVARTLDLGPDALVVVTGVGDGQRHEVLWSALELVQRGTRSSLRRETVTTKQRQLSLGRTLLAGGLPLTRKVERTETVTRGSDEPFALLHRADGGDDVMLYERRLDYRFLAGRLEPASRANLDRTLEMIRARARVPEDDRVAQPGFVAGLPASAADPVDVALHLVRLARRLS